MRWREKEGRIASADERTPVYGMRPFLSSANGLNSDGPKLSTGIGVTLTMRRCHHLAKIYHGGATFKVRTGKGCRDKRLCHGGILPRWSRGADYSMRFSSTRRPS